MNPSPCRGRPRCFDPEQALDSAMLLFWQKGFQRTSLDEIAEAVGIKKPSLYAAFGDKETLFRKVLQRYNEKLSAPTEALQRHNDIREALNAFIELSISSESARGTPRGCLLVTAFADSTLLPPNLALEVKGLVGKAERAVAQRLKKAVRSGQLEPDFDAQGAAKFLVSLMLGVALQIRAGEPRAELQRVKKIALRCLGV
jgi:AcrR family transcriptional regulator